MRLALLAATAAALAAAGCAESPPVAPYVGAAAVPAAATPPRILAQTDSEYVTQAALSNLYEIRAGELAQRKGASAHVRQLGATLARQHREATDMIVQALAQDAVTFRPPDQLDPRRAAMIAELEAASGAEFDRRFLAQQQIAHQEALALHTHYAAGGDDEALQARAAASADLIREHLAMLAHGTH